MCFNKSLKMKMFYEFNWKSKDNDLFNDTQKQPLITLIQRQSKQMKTEVRKA